MNKKIINILNYLIYFFSALVFGFIAVLLILSATSGLITFQLILSVFVTAFSLILTLQGIFTLVWMLYAWEDPEYADKHASPKELITPPSSLLLLLSRRGMRKR